MRDFSELFVESPFGLTASEDAAKHWAGRPATLKRVQDLRQKLTSRSDSTLDLFWANFGAGKTHALLFLKHLLEREDRVAVVVYVETPEHFRTFLDFYRSIALRIPWPAVAEMVDHRVASSNLRQALNAVKLGGPLEQSMAVDWLCGERVHLNELRAMLGISKRIDDDQTASLLISEIARLVGSQRKRFVLLLDEFQRVAGVRDIVRDRVMSSIRAMFNASPQYISVVLAVVTGVESTATGLLTPELRTLLRGSRPLSLPSLDSEGARLFIEERLRAYRPATYSEGALEPFGAAAVDAALHWLISEGHELSPRLLLQALGALVDAQTSGDLIELTPEATVAALRELSL